MFSCLGDFVTLIDSHLELTANCKLLPNAFGTNCKLQTANCQLLPNAFGTNCQLVRPTPPLPHPNHLQYNRSNDQQYPDVKLFVQLFIFLKYNEGQNDPVDGFQIIR